MNGMGAKIDVIISGFLSLCERDLFQNTIDNNRGTVVKLKVNICNYYLF